MQNFLAEPIDLLIGGKHAIKLVKIVKSHKPEKKWDAVFLINGHEKTVSFGATGYEDFTQHHDEHRKSLYLERHGRGRESWSDPTTPGALARWVLWNKPSFRAAVADYKRRFALG